MYVDVFGGTKTSTLQGSLQAGPSAAYAYVALKF